jgi:hypothetical protein
VKTVAEQRTALAASLTAAATGWTVIDVPVDDPIPPCIMLGNPEYTVSQARVATLTWPITLMNVRGGQRGKTADFDEIVSLLITELSKGVGINFVVTNASPRIAQVETGAMITLPEYVIIGTTNVAMC